MPGNTQSGLLPTLTRPRALRPPTLPTSLPSRCVSKARYAEFPTNITTILSGAKVTKQNDGNWTYSPAKFWIRGNAYSFTGIGTSSGDNARNCYTFTAPEKVDAGEFLGKYHGTLVFNNGNGDTGAQGDEDIVWASVKVPTIAENATTAPGTVDFTFDHLLSKVNIKFINNRTDGDIEISNVQINNTSASGTLNFNTIDVGTDVKLFEWIPSYGGCNYNCTFGGDASANASGATTTSTLPVTKDITTDSKFLIPNQSEITISFNIKTASMTEGDEYVNITKEVYFDTPYNRAANYPITCDGVELWPSYQYTLIADITDVMASLGKIAMTVAKVNDYRDLEGETMYYVEADPEVKLGYYSNEEHNSAFVNVTKISTYQLDNLTHYGSAATSELTEIDYKNYSYEWTVDKPNVIYFNVENIDNNDDPDTVTFALGSVTQASGLNVLITHGDKYTKTDCIITLTVKDASGNIVATKDIIVHCLSLEKTYTGGSQDGNDNDG